MRLIALLILATVLPTLDAPPTITAWSTQPGGVRLTVTIPAGEQATFIESSTPPTSLYTDQTVCEWVREALTCIGEGAVTLVYGGAYPETLTAEHDEALTVWRSGADPPAPTPLPEQYEVRAWLPTLFKGGAARQSAALSPQIRRCAHLGAGRRSAR